MGARLIKKARMRLIVKKFRAASEPQLRYRPLHTHTQKMKSSLTFPHVTTIFIHISMETPTLITQAISIRWEIGQAITFFLSRNSYLSTPPSVLKIEPEKYWLMNQRTKTSQNPIHTHAHTHTQIHRIKTRFGRGGHPDTAALHHRVGMSREFVTLELSVPLESGRTQGTREGLAGVMNDQMFHEVMTQLEPFPALVTNVGPRSCPPHRHRPGPHRTPTWTGVGKRRRGQLLQWRWEEGQQRPLL